MIELRYSIQKIKKKRTLKSETLKNKEKQKENEVAHTEVMAVMVWVSGPRCRSIGYAAFVYYSQLGPSPEVAERLV